MAPGMSMDAMGSHLSTGQREGKPFLLVEGNQFPLDLPFQPFGEGKRQHTLFCICFLAENKTLSGPRKAGQRPGEASGNDGGWRRGGWEWGISQKHLVH